MTLMLYPDEPTRQAGWQHFPSWQLRDLMWAWLDPPTGLIRWNYWTTVGEIS